MKKNSDYYEKLYLNENCKIYFVLRGGQKNCKLSVTACVYKLIYFIKVILYKWTKISFLLTTSSGVSRIYFSWGRKKYQEGQKKIRWGRITPEGCKQNFYPNYKISSHPGRILPLGAERKRVRKLFSAGAETYYLKFQGGGILRGGAYALHASVNKF